MVIVKGSNWFEGGMEDLLDKETVRSFYELIGDSILDIEMDSVPESEKERRYLFIDRFLKKYENSLKGSILRATSRRLCERMEGVALGLEDAHDFLEEVTREIKNLNLYLETFGARRFYSERDLGV